MPERSRSTLSTDSCSPVADVDDREARKASAAYLNRIGFFIQDNASDEGWEAAQASIIAAGHCHETGDYWSARAMIDEAFALAFSH